MPLNLIALAPSPFRATRVGDASSSLRRKDHCAGLQEQEGFKSDRVLFRIDVQAVEDIEDAETRRRLTRIDLSILTPTSVT